MKELLEFLQTLNNMTSLQFLPLLKILFLVTYGIFIFFIIKNVKEIWRFFTTGEKRELERLETKQRLVLEKENTERVKQFAELLISVLNDNREIAKALFEITNKIKIGECRANIDLLLSAFLGTDTNFAVAIKRILHSYIESETRRNSDDLFFDLRRLYLSNVHESIKKFMLDDHRFLTDISEDVEKEIKTFRDQFVKEYDGALKIKFKREYVNELVSTFVIRIKELVYTKYSEFLASLTDVDYMHGAN